MIYNMLRDYQKNIVDAFKDRKAFGLWLDMGLGKTPISLAMAEANKCERVIIISINSKATETIEQNGSWAKWATYSDINYNSIRIKSQLLKKSPVYGKKEVIVLNYESLYKRNTSVFEIRDEINDFIKSMSFGSNVALILDESHKIKNASSKNYKAVDRILRNMKTRGLNVYTYLCTGTPFTVGFEDLITQLKLLGCQITKTEFKEMFCILDNKPFLKSYEQPIIGYKNTDRLYELVHKYAVTIKSDEVLDLPEQIFVYHTTPMSNEFRLLVSEKIEPKYIKDYVDPKFLENRKGKVNNPFYRDITYPESLWECETKGQEWLRARQMSIGFQGNEENYAFFNNDRFEQIREFLENNVDNYVIFYNFVPEFIELYKICSELGYNIDIYNGQIKNTKYYDKYENQNADQQFNNKNNVIISNFASGSTGKNWQAYNKCIIVSIPTYGNYEPGIKRIHRFGQNETCFYHVFYQQNWLDYSMLKSLNEKTDYTADMFEEDRIKDLFGGE